MGSQRGKKLKNIFDVLCGRRDWINPEGSKTLCVNDKIKEMYF